MALTDLIEADLLATLDGTGDPQAVLARYAGSKGPLYTALARPAEQFVGLRDRWVTTQGKLQDGERAVADAEDRAKKAERRAADAEKRLKAATTALVPQQGLLDQAQSLRDAGLDTGSLTALTRVFAQVAQSDGITPAKAAVRFLQAATDFEGLAGFERQVREAETRAKKAEADARQREANAKVRTAAVDGAEWFVRHGITAKTVGAWQPAAEQLGLPPETLAQGLVRALQQFGTLEAACQAKAQERDALARDHRPTRD